MNLSINMAPYSLVVIMILIAFTFDNIYCFIRKKTLFMMRHSYHRKVIVCKKNYFIIQLFFGFVTVFLLILEFIYFQHLESIAAYVLCTLLLFVSSFRLLCNSLKFIEEHKVK